MTKQDQSVWKIWLRLNHLTPDIENDYTGEVSTVGHTLRNEDVARRIVEGRSELRYETILSVLNERDEIVLDAVHAGSSVQDGVVRIAPRITGMWTGADRTVDAETHKPSITVTPTVRMRETLANVRLEILGVKDSGAYVGLVTDAATKATDGHITPGGIIVVTGEKLCVFPENEAGLGVFFVSESGVETPVAQISQNDPKRLTFLAPALTAGTYTLKIVTRYTSGKIVLKTPRIIIYDLPLTVA